MPWPERPRQVASKHVQGEINAAGQHKLERFGHLSECDVIDETRRDHRFRLTFEAGAFAGALVDSGLSAAFEAGFLALVLAGFLAGATGSSFLDGGGFEATRVDRLGPSAGSVDSVVFLGGILDVTVCVFGVDEGGIDVW